MFGIKKTKKEVNGKNTYAVSFIGEDKMLGTDRDILTLRINSQIINFMNAYDHIDYYLAGMPAKNSTNPAKTPIFPLFMPNVPSPVQQVRTKSPSTEIIENSDVLVDSREEPLLNSIFRRALRLILRSFHGLYLYTNPRKRLALIARRA